MVPSEIHTGAVATAPRGDFWMGYVPMRGSSGVPDLPMKQAIQNGLYNAVNESITAITPMCSTGNCTWPLYSSLSVCASVNDVSSLLTKTPVPGNVSAMIGGVTDFNVTLPNGAYLLAGQFVLNITTLPSINAQGFSVPLSNHTLSFANEPYIENTTMVNSFIIYRKSINTASETFGAMEILLRWCVNTYNSSTVAGTPTTNITSTSNSVLTANGTTLQLVNGTWSNSSGSGWEMYNQTRYGQLVLPSSNPVDKSNYTVDGAANYALTGFMKGVFKGTYITGFGSTYSTDTAMSLSNALWNAPYTANISGALTEADQDKMQLDGVRNATNNIAVSMTNNLRTRPFWGSPATGTPYNPQSYVHVQWGWLTFLLTLLVSSFAFLLATIIKSKRAKVDIIRSSALAAMCGLSEESKGFMGPIELNGKDGTLEKAGNLRVRLMGGDGGNGIGKGWTLKSAG
ncbi:hypothetical protein BGZ60DRAFT_407752 [Tricladium varicosporioides]|nr:hypothetical protein BGZ60DRAFT_407752 [Hymenoscyphus varicosporioides]